MEADFWHERWAANQIGFHRDSFNPVLDKWWNAIEAGTDARVLVPLCGKSLDMLWLVKNGHHVTGVELSPVAVESFFREHALEPQISSSDGVDKLSTDRIEIYCGDFFQLTRAQLAGINALYDRAALVALPADLRIRYAKQLATLLPTDSRGLLVTLDYDAGQMDGPPFAVSPDEVSRLFGDAFNIRELADTAVLDEYPAFREAGLTELHEHVFSLVRR